MSKKLITKFKLYNESMFDDSDYVESTNEKVLAYNSKEEMNSLMREVAEFLKGSAIGPVGVESNGEQADSNGNYSHVIDFNYEGIRYTLKALWNDNTEIRYQEQPYGDVVVPYKNGELMEEAFADDYIFSLNDIFN